MFIPGCNCCGGECVPGMSPCLPPDSLNFLFSGTFTAGTNLTSAQAAVLNSVLAYPVCLRRVDGSVTSYNTIQADETEWYVLPTTFTINGVSCYVGATGIGIFTSSYSCGWRLGGPPDPFIEWDFWPVSGSVDDHLYLMSWDTGYFEGAGDAYCILASSGSVASGALTLSGSGDDGLTYDSIAGSVSLSTGSCGGAASTQPFRSSNATWSAIGFGGDYYIAPGSFGSPNFSKASATIAGYTGNRPTVTANRAGVVHITADNVYYDFWWRVFRGATKVIEYGSDSTPDEGGNTGSITNTFSVSVGDVITLGDPSDFNTLTNVAIWWTAS